MAKSKGVRLDENHRQALDRMVEAGEAENASEALRQSSMAELGRRGYLTVGTPLTKALNAVGLACGVIGIVWLAVTLVYPVDHRLPAIVFLLAGVGAFTLERVLEDHPVGDALSQVVRRGEKA